MVNAAGRRNLVIAISLLTGLCGILVNQVPNAIGSATLFVIQLIGFITFGLHSAMAVALFPTQLR